MSFGLRLLLNPDETEHSHSNSELLYVIRGECEVLFENRKQFLKKEDMLYVHSGEKHRICGRSEDAFAAKLCFSTEASSKMNGVEFCSVKAKDEAVLSRMRNGFMKILWEEQSGVGEQSFHRTSLCYDILHLLETYYKNPVDKDDVAGQIRSYIYQHYTEELSLQSLADEFHFSSAYLSRMFKQKFGQNFVNYLNQLRLEQATEQIVHTDASITTIAFRHGFSSISTFYKLFKEAYGVQPTDYRKQFREENEEEAVTSEKKYKYLKEHLHFLKEEEVLDPGNEVTIEADIDNVLCQTLNMNSLMNVGPLDTCLDIAFHQDIVKDRAEAGIKILRVWAIIPEGIFRGEVKSVDFTLLDQFLKFCQNEGMIPYLELGGKRTPGTDNQLKSEQLTEPLKKTLEMIVWHAAMNYKSYLPIYFEMRLFEHDEGVPTKENYFELYRYVKDLVNEYFHNVKVGGPGVDLLDHFGSEAEVLTPWVIEEVTPDFFSVKLHPYTVNSRGIRKAIADPDCIGKALSRMKKTMRTLGLERIPVHANYADSFYRTRNYLNDSLWKADYMLKVYQECLGYVEYLAFGRWMDGIEQSRWTDGTVQPDADPNALIGGNGLVCRNGVAKPGYNLLRCMCGIGTQVICSEPGCIITMLSQNRIRIICYNYRHLNYLFYANEERIIDIRDTEVYLEKAQNRTFHLKLKGLKNCKYSVRAFSFTKDRASVLDAWIRKGGEFSKHDSRWLEFYTVPDIQNASADCVGGELSLDVVLEPLEFRSIEVMYEDIDKRVRKYEI